MAFDDDTDTASVLVPIAITATMITSVTANGVTLPEDPNPVWASGTTYAVGQRVYDATTHRVYESLKDSNTGHNPTDPTNQFTSAGVPTWWVDIGPTNGWAAFDPLISTQISGASPLVITLRPGAHNGLALFGLDGDTISVVDKAAPGGEVIYTTGGDVPLEGSMPADYYEYFFDPFKPQTQYIATGIQPYGAAELTITIKKGTGNAKLGLVSVGDVRPLGTPERNSSFEPRTYSSIVEDAYGQTRIRSRPNAVNLSMTINVEMSEADNVAQTLQDLLGIPVAVIGSTAQFHTKLSTFGLISGRLDYNTFPDRKLSLTVKGFT